MQLKQMTDQMARNAEAIRHLVKDITLEQARWRPDPESWSILEVINHLYDEERDDFRTRLDLILYHPGTPWPPIDPPSWAIERRYNERAFDSSLQNFLDERAASLRWLESLSSPDWSVISNHPVLGPMSAGDMMASWISHDFLHLRQLSELYWAYVAEMAAPYSGEYAGPW
ncbi:MAG: DinB family protein [Chloroflexota bacterium]